MQYADIKNTCEEINRVTEHIESIINTAENAINTTDCSSYKEEWSILLVQLQGALQMLISTKYGIEDIRRSIEKSIETKTNCVYASPKFY